jgi:hypothetical protein
VRSFLPLFAAALLLALTGACGRKTGQPSDGGSSGTIIVANSYPAGCSKGTAKDGAFSASLDLGPAVRIADNSSFEFANIAQGSHTLKVRLSGARAEDGAETVLCSIYVAAGASYTERISCDKKGAPSLSCP